MTLEDEILILHQAANIAERDHQEYKRGQGKRIRKADAGPLARELRIKAELRHRRLDKV